MKKKVLGLLLSVTMLASLMLTGCGDDAGDKQGSSDPGTKQQDTGSDTADNTESNSESEEDNGERIELTFWAWWSSDARKPYILEMVDGFNNSQTKYHVTYVDIGWGEIFTNNIAAIAAHDPCDIMANSMEEVRFRASQGQMEPMDEYLTDDVINGFYSQYIDACKGEDGKIYALPYSVDTRAIYYNKDHFKEAGINPEDIKTWDDLIAAARKLDKKADDGSYERIGFMPVLGNGGIDTWVINANQGRNWYGDDLNPQPLVNTETNKEVFNWIREQIDYYGQDEYTKLQEAFGGSMADPFASGKMSMLVHTSAYQAALANSAPDLNYGAIPLPEMKAGNGHAVNGGGFVLEIPKYAKNPEGAYEFIKYATSYEVQDFLSSHMGDFSARNDFTEDSEFFQKEIVADLAVALQETYTTIVPNEYKGFGDVINPELEKITLGIVSVDDGLAAAQAAFEQFIENNQ